MRKKFFIATLLVFTILFMVTCWVSAGAEEVLSGTVVEVEVLENGDIIETVLEPSLSPVGGDGINAGTITNGTKTMYYKSSTGTKLWSVTIKGDFYYNGTTSSCTGQYVSTKTYSSSWSIVSSSSSRSGNTATATATAVHSSGYIATRSVSVSCSPSGVIS